MSKDYKIWVLLVELMTHGEEFDGMSIHESGDGCDEAYKVYHSDGYCWEFKKEFICIPEDVQYYQDVDKDGCCYTFIEPWDTYEESGIDKATQIILNLIPNEKLQSLLQ